MSNFLRIIKYGWLNFTRNASVSSATVGIMVLALSVVAGLLLVGNITDTFVQELQGKVDISVYFDTEADESHIVQLQLQLEARDDVRDVEYVSRDEALTLFKDRHRDNDILLASLGELGANPFQASLNVKAHDTSRFEEIAQFVESSQYSGSIEKVNFKENEAVIQKLTALTASIKNIGIFFALALSIVVMLITFNTMRLVIYNSREEISVMRVVGASDWFIRGPFIFAGALYGVIASFTTWFLFFLALWLLGGRIDSLFPGTDVFGYWTSNFFTIFLALLAFGGGLGVISSFVAIRRYLKV